MLTELLNRMSVGNYINCNYTFINYCLKIVYGFIMIIIIRKGQQCKAGKDRLTPYQSEDPNPTTPTHRIKEEKGKTVGNKK